MNVFLINKVCSTLRFSFYFENISSLSETIVTHVITLKCYTF